MINQSSRTKFFPRFSFTQVMASALAAGSAALAARYLGVIGTVVGAVVVGGLATIATTLYEHSIERTNVALRKAAVRSARHVEGIVATLPVVAPTSKALARLRRSAQEVETPTPPGQHSIAQAAAGLRTLRSVSPPSVVSVESSMFNRVIAAEPAVPPGNRRVSHWKMVAGVTAAVFVTAMATVTGFELAGGTSLSELLHGPAEKSGGRQVTIEQPVIVKNTSVQPTVRVTTSVSPSPTPTPTPSSPNPSPSPTRPTQLTPRPTPDPENTESSSPIPGFPQPDRD
ncbi:MAG: hypothetical protein ACRDTD_24945 [Pseudonocardiaceae bacterium]